MKSWLANGCGTALRRGLRLAARVTLVGLVGSQAWGAEILNPNELVDSYALGASIPGGIWAQGTYNDNAGTVIDYYFSGFVIGALKDATGNTITTYLALPTHGFSFANESLTAAGTGNYLTGSGFTFANLTAEYIPSNFNPSAPNMTPGNVSIFSSTTAVPDSWILPIAPAGSLFAGMTISGVGAYGTPSTPNGSMPRTGDPMGFNSQLTFAAPGNVDPSYNFSGRMYEGSGISTIGAGNNGDSGTMGLVNIGGSVYIAGMAEAVTGGPTDTYRTTVFANFTSSAYYSQIAPYAGIVVVGPPTLSFQIHGINLVLTWTGAFALQSATNVAGPFAMVASATSPFTNAMNLPQVFFRLSSTNAP